MLQVGLTNGRIRSASAVDAAALSYLSYEAGRGQVERSAYDLMIPGPPGPTRGRLSFMERVLTTETVSWFHHSRFSVWEEEGRAVASLCSYAKASTRTLPLFAALGEAGWSDHDIALMGDRMQPFLSALPGFRKDTWIIENVGCLEGFRRRGFARALLQDAVRRGADAGHRFVQVNVFIGNAPAIKAYERIGFRIEGEKRHRSFERFFGCPGMYMMTFDTALPRGDGAG
jgi:ribosomal protein S18 acetylase RimI-like enzyme